MREYKNKRSGNKEGVADSETLTNSTHSSLNGNVDEDFTSNTDDHSKSPLQNYFNSNITEEYNNTTVSFFDGCAHATAFNETATAYDRETSASDGTPTTVAFVDLTKESHQQEYLTENAVSRQLNI